LLPVSGNLQLNPPMDTLIQTGDKLIFISEDDDTVILSNKIKVDVDESIIARGSVDVSEPERTLILGWNWRGLEIIHELDQYVPAGSEVTVVARAEASLDSIKEECNDLINQSVQIVAGDTTDRKLLDSLDIGAYQHVIILCYSDLLSLQQADAHTLVTLLHLRDISEKTGKVFSIVSEMLDIRNRNLADVTRADDFIVSNKLISLMLAQISENKQLNAVFTDIFDPDGSEIYLKKSSRYVNSNQPTNFYTITESAARLGEIAIGYRIKAHANDPSKAYGVVVNPNKSDKITLTENDKIIVLAEN
jgi:voltage-gated potassium channel Kch